MARQKSITPATVFSATVRAALEHVADPQWLGEHSPLATPYFLGRQSPDGSYPTEARDRGLVLQNAIREAAGDLWGGPLPASRDALAKAVDDERFDQGSRSSRYHYYLLELRYLRRHYPPSTFPTAVEAMPGFVNVSPTRFFIHLDEAIDELCRRLLDRLSPALRLERPGLARAPVGRSETVITALAEFQAGRSVAVSGQGGVGKSTLGAAIIASWPGEVFWHTFRPGLNDDLNNLLFNLGHFLRNAGAPTLWGQLLAGEGKDTPVARVVGMLRMDLEAIAASRPLLCFDEMDLLQTTEGDPRRKQHAQVLELLESLRGVAPLLLIGQRVYVDTDAHIALEPLPPTESGELLRLLGLEPDAALLHQVHQFTRGNPRLLELYAALRHSGEEADDLLRLSRAPSSQPLFSRLWRRLDPAERDLMGMLSVFRTYAPRDAWPEGEKTLADLVNRGLIKIDLAEGVALLPFFRELIYGALPPERLKHMHVGAANLRAGLGDYTAAAFHFVQAGDPDTAVEVWFAHQNQEVLAGQAAAAGEIFQPLAPDQLEEANRTRLRVIQNRLALLAGEADRVLEGMEGFTWEVDDETTAEALGQWAYALEVRDEFDGALARYDEAIDMLSRATQKVTGWHLRRGFVYMGASDPSRAREEVLSAKCDIERLQGIIDYEIGQYASAQTHYRTALQYAEEAADERRIAGVHHIMSLTAGRLGDMAEARANTEKAIEFYARIGDRVQLEGVRAELAGLYLNVRQFEEVIGPAEKALQYFERIKHDRWIASISTNLAEAYLETGRPDEAKEMVFKVMRMEIPSDQPYALYTLGHLHDREGNPEHAAKSFRQGIDIATANHDPFIEAYLQRALGSLLGKNGDAGKGREHLETALRMFTEMGLEHETGPTAEAIRALG